MEKDPVVKEIPVYLSKALENKLYVVRYPTHPMRDGSENFAVLKSSVKPESQEFRFDIAVDTENSNYDHSKGVQLALNAMKESKRNDIIFDSELLDKTVLSSTQLMTDCSNYVVGIFQNNELHITPLKTIIEMKPQFDYLEKGDKRAKDETKTTEEGDDEKEEDGAPVKVTFARHQSDHAKKFQEQSFQYQPKKKQGECCIHTTYVPMHAAQTHLTRMEMFCETAGETVNSLNLSPQEYLDLLMIDRRTPQHCTKSFEHVKTLSLQEQIMTIMKNARVMSFRNLRTMLSSEHSTTDVLSYLQKAAVLVQGNWVVKSELIYPKESTSSENGVPGEVMCKARDYILLCFTENSYIKRDQLSSIVKLPSAEVIEILEKLATKDSTEGWKLMLPPDWEFCERYSELAERQQMFWEATRKYLRECHVPQRQRRKSNRESLGSENEEKNIGRGRKSHRDSSLSDNDGATEPVKSKKTNRSRKNSETTTT